METFSALLALCEGNPLVTGGFPSQRPVTRSFEVFFDARLNKRLSKQSKFRWFKMPWRSLLRHYNSYSSSLKQKCLHFDEILITGCTGSCQNDNFQCTQRWKFRQNDDIFVSVSESEVTTKNAKLTYAKPQKSTIKTELCVFWGTIPDNPIETTIIR